MLKFKGSGLRVRGKFCTIHATFLYVWSYFKIKKIKRKQKPLGYFKSIPQHSHVYLFVYIFKFKNRIITLMLISFGGPPKYICEKRQSFSDELEVSSSCSPPKETIP